MKSTTAILIVLIAQFASAQSYKPFPTDDATWKIGRCWYFFPGGWYDEHIVHLSGEDTIVNSVSYKKLFITFRLVHGSIDSAYTRYLGGIRESDRKIFMVSEEFCLDTFERLVYDFGEHGVGDTILTNVFTNSPLQKIPHVVTAIDSIQVGAGMHRRLHLSDTSGFISETWIEGIGSNWGLPYATYWTITDNSYDLVCFNHLGALRYQNPSPSFSFCTSPFPQIECDTGILPPAGCVAAFTYLKQTDTVTFAGNSNLTVVSGWQWDFGDGQTSESQNPQHVYEQSRWFEPCLTVTGIDSSGANCTITICDSIYITDGCIDSSLICAPWSLCCDAPLYEPVCGCDSVTYDNACIASLWHGVLHTSPGPCLTSVKNSSELLFHSNIFPNPASENTRLQIETTETGILHIRIKTIQGKIISKNEIPVNAGIHLSNLDLRQIPAGLYIVELLLNGNLSVQKFVRR